MSKTIAADNGGRRLGIERRQFAYTGYSPERRSGNDRRCGTDRRNDRYKNRHDGKQKIVFNT